MDKVLDQVDSSDLTPSSSGAVTVEDTVERAGNVRITVEEDGVEEVVFDDHNLIVNGARKALTHLIAEASAGYAIAEIKLGTKGHDLVTNDLLTPIPPMVDDIGLTDTTAAVWSELLATLGNSFVYQSVGDSSVMFSIVLEKEEANGNGNVAYTEAGLFCANGTLFAKETFPAIVKNSNRRITFEWTILF